MTDSNFPTKHLGDVIHGRNLPRFCFPTRRRAYSVLSATSMLIRGYRLVSIALLPNRCRIGTPAGEASPPPPITPHNQTVGPRRWDKGPLCQRQCRRMPGWLVTAATRPWRGRPCSPLRGRHPSTDRGPEPGSGPKRILRAPTHRRPGVATRPSFAGERWGCAIAQEVGSCICRRTQRRIACEKRARLGKTVAKSFAPWPADR